uniref:Uncharacterized protein n=1 Tax=Anguilla anguilla TaxID=7936 RepID=A0A0E9V4N3_ANGAN
MFRIATVMVYIFGKYFNIFCVTDYSRIGILKRT